MTTPIIYTWDPPKKPHPHASGIVNFRKLDWDPREIIDRAGVKRNEPVCVGMEPYAGSLPNVLATRESIAQAKADGYLALAPLLEGTVDYCRRVRDLGHDIRLVAVNFERVYSAYWYLTPDLETKNPGPYWTYFGADGPTEAIKPQIDAESDANWQLLNRRIRTSLVLPLRDIGIDAPVVQFKATGQTTPDGIACPRLYKTLGDAIDRLAACEGQTIIPWVGDKGDPNIGKLVRLAGCKTVLLFNSEYSAEQEQAWLEALAG